MNLYVRKILTFKYPVGHLKQFLKVKPQYGSNQSGIERTSKEEARYVRITDIDEYGNLKDNLGATAEVVENKYVLNDNNILFARSGATVGKSYLHQVKNVDYTCFFAGYMIRFIVDEKRLLPAFLFSYTQLNVYKEWTKAIQRAAGQPNINSEEYKELFIPIPPIEIQAQIVQKFNQAYELKRQKEAEAKALLKSIDGYLLEKLGIELPTANEPKKFFYTRFKDVQGKRFDANAFKEDRINSIQSLNNCIFPIEKLKFVTKFIKNIVTKNHQQLPYLGLENIESNTGFYIETTEKESFSSAFHFFKNHVIFPKLRPYLNKVTKTNFEGLCSTEFHVLQPHKVTSDFLAIFLRSSLVINQTKCLMSGNTLPRLQTEDIESLLIPIPDLNTQFEIASYVTETFDKANQLKSEAKEAIETAKAEVERMILGES